MRFLALLVLCCLCLGGTATAKPVIDIQTATLPNGAVIWLNHDPHLPIVSMHLTLLRSGSANDPPSKAGLANMMAQMLTEGAGQWDSRGFQAELDNAGITLGFGVDRDDLFGVVYASQMQSEKAFSLLHAALNQPLFEGRDLTRLQASALADLRDSASDPEWQIARLTNAIVFADHPYAANSGGTLASIPKITPRDLQLALRQRLHPSLLRVSFAGNITLDQAAAVVTRLTADWPSGPLPELPRALPDQAFAPRTILHPNQIPQTLITMVWRDLRRTDPDDAAAHVLTHILGGGFGSRLTQTIREEKGLTYGVTAERQEWIATPRFEVSLSTKNETAAEAITLTTQITKGMCQSPVTAAELNDAKAYLIQSQPMRFTSLRTTSSQMNALQAAGLPASYLTTRQTAIAAVTAADVQRVAQRVFCTANQGPVTLLVGQPDGIQVDKTLTTLPGFTN